MTVVKLKPVREADLYPVVEKWMRARWKCFAAGKNVGTRLGRIDVAGIRDIGGDLSGQTEVISIEVKAGTQVFTTAAGQASGYSVYADRVYLADYRPARTGYSDDEIAIAGKLGIGLLLIRPNHRINVVQTSPLHEPLEGLRRRVVQAMGHADCSLCNAVFELVDSDGPSKVPHVVRAGAKPGALRKAVRAEKGYVWWLDELGNRDTRGRDQTYHRRYLCPDCTWNLFRDFTPDGD